jgi:hypothetical protein
MWNIERTDIATGALQIELGIGDVQNYVKNCKSYGYAVTLANFVPTMNVSSAYLE